MSAEAAPVEAGARPLLTFRVSTAAWALVGCAFVMLRLAPVWQAPVHGLELIHLSGAWQARIGVADARFMPTLFQAVAALGLHWTASELPARIVAFAAMATVPAAVYLLRPKLGEAGALLALLLLAFDAPGLALGAQASALGFDLPLALWLFVLVTRRPPVPWLAVAAAFLAATAGPLVLPLVFGWAAALLWERDRPPVRGAALVAAGAAAGVLLSSLRFGLGWDGLVIAPLRLFSAGYDQTWSTATTMDAVAVYAWPVLGVGLAAGVLRLANRRPVRLDRHERVLLGWGAASLAWSISSANSHTTVPLVALTTPLALYLGPALARALAAMMRADWYVARFLLPAAAFAGLLAVAIASDWARLGRLPGSQAAFCYLLLGLAGLGLAAVAVPRATRPALVAAGAVLLLPVVAGTFGVALGAAEDPLLSPWSPPQLAELRAAALAKASVAGGLIVVHPSFEEDITWGFRDSGTLVVASRVPPNAAVVIWPRELAKPEGMVPLEGEWTLMRAIEPPASSALSYLHWLIDRHSPVHPPEGVAVYVRGGQ